MKAIIYQLVSPSNKFYIGSTKTSLDKRLNVHLHYLKNNKHTNKRLQGAYNKYGFFNVFILEEFEYLNNEDVITKEQYYLDTLNPEYNVCKKAYTSEMSSITREKIRNTLKGKSFTEERKKNISKGRKGIKPKLSKEFIEVSKVRKKELFSKAVIGLNIITKEEVQFNSIKDAEINLKLTNLSTHLSRKQSRCGDYVFKFKNDSSNFEDLIIIANNTKQGGKKDMGNRAVISTKIDIIPNSIETFKNASQCAEYYKISVETVRRHIKSGKGLKNTNIYFNYKD